MFGSMACCRELVKDVNNTKMSTQRWWQLVSIQLKDVNNISGPDHENNNTSSTQSNTTGHEHDYEFNSKIITTDHDYKFNSSNRSTWTSI
jgi:hypothetical protein